MDWIKAHRTFSRCVSGAFFGGVHLTTHLFRELIVRCHGVIPILLESPEHPSLRYRVSLPCSGGACTIFLSGWIFTAALRLAVNAFWKGVEVRDFPEDETLERIFLAVGAINRAPCCVPAASSGLSLPMSTCPHHKRGRFSIGHVSTPSAPSKLAFAEIGGA
jgi:hypothetical protein